MSSADTSAIAFRLPVASRAVAPAVVKLVRGGSLLAVHSSLDLHGDGAAVPYVMPSFGLGEAIICAVQLRPLAKVELWRNGRALGPFSSPAGGVQVFDLRHAWRAAFHSSHDSVNFNIPLALLIRLGGRPEADFTAFEDGRSDVTLHHLAAAILPAFSSPSEASGLLGEQILNAVAARLVALQGEGGDEVRRKRGGLSLWQQRRASDILLGALHADVGLAELAQSCALSPSHFGRAFRVSFGLPPHRWLLTQRVRRASELMQSPGETLDQIAVACGFVDQSHLSRVFRRVMGVAPGAWRRAHRG